MIWFCSNRTFYVISHTSVSCFLEFSHKNLHSGFRFFTISHLFVCLLIPSPNNMSNFLLELGFSFGWSWSENYRQIILDWFSISYLFLCVFFRFLWNISVSFVSVMFFAAGILLIEESWFMLILSWCVFTELAWLMDENWLIDEPFVYLRDRKLLHDPFFLIYLTMCLFFIFPI